MQVCLGMILTMPDFPGHAEKSSLSANRLPAGNILESTLFHELCVPFFRLLDTLVPFCVFCPAVP